MSFNVHFSGYTDVAHLVSVGELAWFFMCTLLVIRMRPVLFQQVGLLGF